MAKGYGETRHLDATANEIWQAAIHALHHENMRVSEQDRASWTIYARPSLASEMLTGGLNITTRIYDGAVEVNSEMRKKFALTDLGKNKRTVTSLLNGIEAKLRGEPSSQASLIDQAREQLERLQSSTQFTSTASSAITATPPGQARVPAQAPRTTSAPRLIEIIHGSERLEVVDIDECPVDNRAGGVELQVEHEFTHTVTAGVNVVDESSIAGKAGIGWKVLSAEIDARARREQATSQQTQISRTYKATFRVAAKGAVLYRILWRRRVTDCEAIIEIDGERFTVPFTVVDDLEHAVGTAPLDENWHT